LEITALILSRAALFHVWADYERGERRLTSSYSIKLAQLRRVRDCLQAAPEQFPKTFEFTPAKDEDNMDHAHAHEYPDQHARQAREHFASGWRA
jgi:hypothetical protein